MMKLSFKKILTSLSIFSLYSSTLIAGQFAGLDGKWDFKFSEKPYQNQTIELTTDEFSSPVIDLSQLEGEMDFYQSTAVFVHLYGDMSRPSKQLFPAPGMGFAVHEGEPYLILFSEKGGNLEAGDALKILSFSQDKIELTSSKKRYQNKVLATLTRVQ